MSCVSCLVVSSFDLHIPIQMNQLDVVALEKAVEYDCIWEAVILCPISDSCGDSNLLRQTPKLFRKTKCGGKEGELSGHSRQHTQGIRIPTSFSAVLSEWVNVKSQLCGWAWNGGTILVAKHFQSTERSNLIDKSMRCSRCEPYATTSSKEEVSTILYIVYHYSFPRLAMFTFGSAPLSLT